MNVMRPEDFHRSYFDTFNSGDIDLLMNLYEPNSVLVPQPDQVAAGQAAIRAALIQFQAMGKLRGETRFCITAGDTALASASWQITGTGPDGQPVDLQGTSVEILHRQADGHWLLVVDHPFGGM
jgi:ketosteroid isomerase-like protein